MASFLLPVAAMRTEFQFIDFDYSYYLGPDYKVNHSEKKKTPTIISNHVSWLDTFIIIKYMPFSPSGNHVFSTLPVTKQLGNSTDTIWLPKTSAD